MENCEFCPFNWVSRGWDRTVRERDGGRRGGQCFLCLKIEISGGKAFIGFALKKKTGLSDQV